MRRLILSAGVLAAALTGAAQAALTPDTFQIRTAGDLVSLCAPSTSDPNAVAAVHMCQGFLVGAYTVLKTDQEANPRLRLFCTPEPPPSRNDAIAAFITWVNADPSRAALPPVDGVVGYLHQAYPCPVQSSAQTRRK
ncbi:conserved exported protein of unknown function [Rhodovastum atsumiense]|uniref:Rap1a immunity protein domain-containing protein n=1 Tax=Rhodovastum atsumiense TaxID=504468 RepID=A0A5M6ILP8_9PROT|nr:Rap1a/Tai family immunity protein [Rhodovastum atsumiense]KAA5609201.1 hypothetical protein F1189_25225 [Rhodovastum atsumiense]CAH2603972.1 conserved exported protein of unknown function [Rhodovastum atsumiense]